MQMVWLDSGGVEVRCGVGVARYETALEVTVQGASGSILAYRLAVLLAYCFGYACGTSFAKHCKNKLTIDGDQSFKRPIETKEVLVNYHIINLSKVMNEVRPSIGGRRAAAPCCAAAARRVHSTHTVSDRDKPIDSGIMFAYQLLLTVIMVPTRTFFITNCSPRNVSPRLVCMCKLHLKTDSSLIP